jgi:polyribonucleotide nucleotidyltransferase
MILYVLLLIGLAAIVVGDCLYEYNRGVDIRSNLAELIDGFIINDNTKR